MKKILVAFGTRPEVIKLAPVIKALQQNSFEVKVVHTGQHKELADDMLKLFNITPDYNLHSMRVEQDLFNLSTFLLTSLQKVFTADKPDAVIVQGDTTSGYISSLAAFYLHIPVFHVEAGLRSFDLKNPFPEEMNRKQISTIANLHFAPTEIAQQNLLNEGISESSIYLTGNTVIDALFQIKSSDQFKNNKPSVLNKIPPDKKLILLTAHRRENHGAPLLQIMKGVIQILESNKDAFVLFPAHPSPNVQQVVHNKEFAHPRLLVVEPLGYLEFHHILEHCTVILTDSGGIQEEAAALNKKMLVLRSTTERQELVESGFTKLVGFNSELIAIETERLLTTSNISNYKNPYGEGNSSTKIIDAIRDYTKNIMVV